MLGGLIVVGAFCLGYIIGTIQNGVKVDINQKPYELPLDKEGNPQYNETVVDNLDEQVRLYSESYGKINERK